MEASDLMEALDRKHCTATSAARPLAGLAYGIKGDADTYSSCRGRFTE